MTRLLLAFLTLCLCTVASAQSAKTLKARELANLHDYRSVVANGNLYAKSEWLVAARELLKKEGKARGFGVDWTASHPQWQRAESILMQPYDAEVRKRFESLAWLKPQFVAIIERDFNETEIDALLAHFKSPEGSQQLRMLDHALANNVLGAFSLTHRLKTDVPGAEAELKRTQEMFYRGEEAMIFEVVNSQAGIQFAFSPHGKKYTYDIVTNAVLLFVRQLQDEAARIPAILQRTLPQAQSALEAYAQDAR
jgi:hypothetical protein